MLALCERDAQIGTCLSVAAMNEKNRCIFLLMKTCRPVLLSGCMLQGTTFCTRSGLDRELIVTRMLEVLTTNTDWRGQISVVDERRIRSRALPAQDDYTV